MVLSINTFLEFATVAALLPLAGTLLIKRGKLSAFSKDMWIARFSQIVAVLGFVGIALAQTKDTFKVSLAVLALSKGLESAVRSVLATLAGDSVGSGVLFSTYSVFHSLAVFVYGPIMAFTFRAGLSLPLWIAAAFVVPGAIILSTIRDAGDGKTKDTTPYIDED